MPLDSNGHPQTIIDQFSKHVSDLLQTFIKSRLCEIPIMIFGHKRHFAPNFFTNFFQIEEILLCENFGEFLLHDSRPEQKTQCNSQFFRALSVCSGRRSSSQGWQSACSGASSAAKLTLLQKLETYRCKKIGLRPEDVAYKARTITRRQTIRYGQGRVFQGGHGDQHSTPCSTQAQCRNLKFPSP